MAAFCLCQNFLMIFSLVTFVAVWATFHVLGSHGNVAERQIDGQPTIWSPAEIPFNSLQGFDGRMLAERHIPRRRLRGVFRDIEGKTKNVMEASPRPIFAMHVSANNTSGWTFKFPYNSDATCSCEEAIWGEYVSEDECVRAYAESDFEDCLLHQKFKASDKFRRLSEPFDSDPRNCDFAVATNIDYSNRECRHLCIRYHEHDNSAFSYFEKNCKMEYYHVASRVPKTQNTNCFDNWIFGNSDDFIEVPPVMQPMARHFGFYRMELDVLNAADCQTICQEDRQCTRWFWRRSPREGANGDLLYGSTGEMFTCFLRNYQSTVSAIDTLLVSSVGISPFDPRWANCNLHKTQGCLMPPGSILVDNTRCKECAICKCQPKCVWKSTEHVSGPKHCANPTSLCERPKVYPQTYPPRPKVYTTAAPPATVESGSVTTVITSTAHPHSQEIRDPQTTTTTNAPVKTDEGVSGKILQVSKTTTATKASAKTRPPTDNTKTQQTSPPSSPNTTTAAAAEPAVGGIVTGALAAAGGLAAVGAVVYKGWIGASMFGSSPPPLEFTPRFDNYDETLMRDHEQFQPVDVNDFS